MRREEAEREAREALYAERVSLAMRFASKGHNRDVVLGALLGAQCDEPAARQIADSAVALHESRQAREAEAADHARRANDEVRAEEKEAAPASAANSLGAIWFQFLNNLRF